MIGWLRGIKSGIGEHMFDTDQPQLTDTQRQVLGDEISRLQTLYLDATSSIQSVFNFYLSFLTAVIGVVIFIVESSGTPNNGVLIILLLFAALVGTVYLSALSGRYGHATRFAHALDQLRRQQITMSNAPMPPIYSEFVNEQPAPQPEPWILWLVPTGTYQLFMAVMNAAALGLMVALTLNAGEVGGGASGAAAFFVFLVTLTVMSAYSRLTINRFVRQLDVRVDMGSRLSGWASRQ